MKAKLLVILVAIALAVLASTIALAESGSNVVPVTGTITKGDLEVTLYTDEELTVPLTAIHYGESWQRGSVYTFPFYAVNTGQDVANYTISLVGDTTWANISLVHPVTMTLAPGESVMILLVIDIPFGALLEMHEFTIVDQWE